MVGRLGISTGRTIRVDASGRNCSQEKALEQDCKLARDEQTVEAQNKNPGLAEGPGPVCRTRGSQDFPDGSTVAAMC